MRAPATSPIPAPVSAPQTAKGNEASDASPFAALMEAVTSEADAAPSAKTDKTIPTTGKNDSQPDVAQPPQPGDGGTQAVFAGQAEILLQDNDAAVSSVIADAAPLLTDAQTQSLPALLVAQEEAGDENPDPQAIADARTEENKTDEKTSGPEGPALPKPVTAEITPDLLGQVAMVQPIVAPTVPTPPPANSNLPDAEAEPSELVAAQPPAGPAPAGTVQAPPPQLADETQATAPQPVETPAAQSPDNKAPSPDTGISLAQTEDAPAADGAAPPPVPKPGKQANARPAAANTVHDTHEQRLDGTQASLPDRVTLDATPMVSVLQTMPQATDPAAQQGAQQSTDAADAVTAAPPATAPAEHKDMAANALPAMPALSPQDGPASPPQAAKADTSESAQKADAHGKSGDVASAAADQIAQGVSEAPRPQAPQAPAANTNFAQHLAAVTDGDAPVQTGAPGITQHVSVTNAAQATPDLPSLAINIRARSQSGAKQFDIRLDPPELGRVEVRLSIDHAGKASAHLTADQPQTLDLLQKDSAVLARALREAGLNVSQDGLNFSLRQGSQDTGAQDMGGRDGARGQRSTTLNASKSIEATATSAAYRAPADGRLDIRV